jgi:hypothetical protein
MQIELKMDPKQIEAEVINAIAASAFGERLKEAVDDALKQLGNRYTYDDQLKKWVEYEMRQIVEKYVKENYTTKLQEAIAAFLTPEVLNQATERAVANVMAQFKIGREY